MKRTIVIECEKCKGTGLIKNNFTSDNTAILCPCCNGSGKVDFTYSEFEGRKKCDDVTHVFKDTYSKKHYDKDTEVEGTMVHFSNFGISYEDWLNGIEVKPVEELYCPYIYNWNYKSNIYPCSQCKDYVEYAIEECKFYPNKSKCWEEWHKNNN